MNSALLPSACRLVELPGHVAVNRALLAGFLAARDAPDLRRSHWLEGRYENLYVPRQRLPAIEAVLALAVRETQALLGIDFPLRAGFWFNAMEPGQRTLPHTHDDDDELMSAVYYVQVSPGSGDLLLGDPPARIEPRAGRMVLFPPDLPHEVTVNRSDRLRLSIGINVGPEQVD
ncbi:2OG-Fe(II) oxygenase [Thiohalobacter sp.]|uniref:2OG-Fe(II) oxygenase n=1 Tax=Thiohalobacter sp. TaxID=2025948 RepID=UPI0026361F26|nr:2OG-Fe(II) oxygenase [Thiohalobacter sp.]